jgi:hypothetical protein
MYDLKQFQQLIARVTGEQGLYSRTVVSLLLGTSAKESDFGTYLRQLGGGPALGAFQMEPATVQDTWKNYLYLGRTKRREAIYKISGVRSHRDNGAMEWNLAYQICMARLHYRRIPEPFPAYNDIEGLGLYWDTHWNRNPEKGTVKQFIKKWDQFIGRGLFDV